MEPNGTHLIPDGPTRYSTNSKMLAPGDYSIECATIQDRVVSRRKGRVKARGDEVRRALTKHWHRHYDEPDAPCDLSELL